ncbi:hypothetical protein P4O66_006987 [Electrophorus voltai]|uniref:Inosine/uridine-preferring nucleoside hydrolase domain-containing protein n=1 Tax=Electrophorus voltai TaxID=2609070 RepID=A0AAD8ZFX7_9TELE|nr:hypothetical protein P4O66_006987 [Electrophorus voltai]
MHCHGSSESNTVSKNQLQFREYLLVWVSGGAAMKKLLLDVDCGVDDAQAIMMALASPGVQIVGITCVHGNTSVENVCKNTLRVLKVCQRQEIPVFCGAGRSLLGKTLNAERFHGQDGLGDVPDPQGAGLEQLQREGAVAALIRLANEHSGEVSVVATAPLTNLALAVRIDPSLPQKLKGLYVMGGNTDSRGNATVCAEFNFAADPEAASIVLSSFLCPTYITTWESACRNKLPWSFCDGWLAQDSEKADFMKRIFRHTMEAAYQDRFQREMVDGVGFVSCDSYAMAAAIDETLVTQYEEMAVSVELCGRYTRGMLVLDTVGFLPEQRNVFIMKKVNVETFKRMMMDALN